MAQSDGDGISRIVRLWHFLQMQQPLCHILHLVLGGIAVTYYRLLDLGGLISIYLKTGLPHSKKDHTPCLGNTNTGGDILSKEQLFDGHRVRLCHLQELSHILINDLQPGGKIHTRRGGDGTAAQKGTASPVCLYQSKTGDPITGVDS